MSYIETNKVTATKEYQRFRAANCTMTPLSFITALESIAGQTDLTVDTVMNIVKTQLLSWERMLAERKSHP